MYNVVFMVVYQSKTYHNTTTPSHCYAYILYLVLQRIMIIICDVRINHGLVRRRTRGYQMYEADMLGSLYV